MQKQRSLRMGISHPPQFQPTITVSKRLRFKATAAATSAAPTVLDTSTFADLWCVAATTTSAYGLASHARLRKIEMWGPMASDLVPVTVQVDWTGSTTVGGSGRSNRVSDTSMGASEPAHLASKPPPNSQVFQWFDVSSGFQICTLAYPAGAIIDVTYDLVVRDDGSAQAVQGAVAGATVGANYVRSLDSVTGSNLPPVSLATI